MVDFKWCLKTVHGVRTCLTNFAVLSEEERHFQEYQFESTRQICLKLTICVCLVKLLEYVTQDYKKFHLQDVEDQASWELSLLKHFRLIQFSGSATLAIICIASSSRFPRIRSTICSHQYILWLGIAALALFSTLFMELMLERQIAWSSIDRCDALHITRYCPNITWASTSVSHRIAVLYGVNFIFFYFPFRFTLVFNMCFLVCLLCTVIPFEPLKDQIWTRERFDPSILFGLVQTIIHVVISIMYGRNYAIEVHKAFICSKEIQQTKEKTRMVLGTLIPDRVLSLINFTPGGASELFYEEFPMVTVLFCSFDKKDVLNMTSATEFFQHLADIIGEFDKIVDEAGLCKVEHIGEDYVVASPVIQTGLAENDMHYGYKRTAIKIVEVALALVKLGNASTGGQMPFESTLDQSSSLPSRPPLCFSAGIHSGPLIGAVAGKKRRFYRLFGDTVNTAARMRQHASEGSVQISCETKKLITSLDSDSFKLVEHGIKHIKGKGQMATFTAVPSAKPDTQVWIETPVNSQPRTSSPASLLQTSSEIEGNSTPLGGPLDEVCLMTELEVKSDSMSARPPAVGNIQQQPSVFLNAFVTQQDEERLTLWDDAMKEVSKELSLFSGKFRSARIEEEYNEAGKDMKLEDWRKQILLTVIVHAIFFPAMYPALRYSEPNFGEMWMILIGVSGFLFLFHLGFWVQTNLRGQQSGSYSVLLSPAVSALAMLVLFGLSNSPFALLGVVIAIVMRHPNETPLSYLCLSIVMMVLSAVMYRVVLESFENFQNLLSSLIIFVVVMTFFRLLHCRALRSTWKLSVELNHQSRFLDRTLTDLVPSTRAKTFVQKRFSIMAQPMQNLNEEESQYFSADVASFGVVDRSSEAFVLQSDLVGFTPLCQSLKPQQVVELLHELWCIADSVLDQCKQTRKASGTLSPLDRRHSGDGKPNGCNINPQSTSTLFKMDTVGDAYIVIAQLLDHSHETKIQVASELISIASATMNSIHIFSTEQAPKLLGVAPGAVKMRMGMALGIAVSGVVGYLRPRYHVFGEVVQKAAYVESLSTPGCLRVDENIQRLFQELKELEDGPTFSLIRSLDCPHRHLELPLTTLSVDDYI